MACDSIEGIGLDSCINFAGGLLELYVIAFKDLKKLTGSNDVYSIDSVSDLVDEIGVVTSKQFMQIGIDSRASNGITQSATIDGAAGVFFFNPSTQFILRGLTRENAKWIKSVGSQPVAFIARDRNNQFIAVGLEGDTRLNALDGGTGLTVEEGQNLTVTFTGVSQDLVLHVDPTLIPSLLVPAV